MRRRRDLVERRARHCPASCRLSGRCRPHRGDGHRGPRRRRGPDRAGGARRRFDRSGELRRRCVLRGRHGPTARTVPLPRLPVSPSARDRAVVGPIRPGRTRPDRAGGCPTRVDAAGCGQHRAGRPDPAPGGVVRGSGRRLLLRDRVLGGLHRMDPAVGGAGTNLCPVRGAASRPSRTHCIADPGRRVACGCATRRVGDVQDLGCRAGGDRAGLAPGPASLADRVAGRDGSRRRGDRDLSALLRRGARTDVADGRRRSAGAWALQLVTVRPVGWHPHPRPAPSGRVSCRVRCRHRDRGGRSPCCGVHRPSGAALCCAGAVVDDAVAGQPVVVPALSGIGHRPARRRTRCRNGRPRGPAGGLADLGRMDGRRLGVRGAGGSGSAR